MSQSVSEDDLELELLDADLDEWEAAWFDDEFAAIIARNWSGEPPSTAKPGRLPARWDEPAPAVPPALRRSPAPRRLVAASLSRQRSPPR